MFITFEGPEGAGKTTIISYLGIELRRLGYRVCLTREPGGSHLGTKLREIILNQGDVDYRTELFLFLADRAQHVADVIRPALLRGEIVLCDRYVDSTIVYQGYARGLNISFLRQLNEFATQGLKPDLTFFLDIDPIIGLKRQTKQDRLDREPLDFHQKVRQGFIAEAQMDPSRWKIIDASEYCHKVQEEVLKIIMLYLEVSRV